MLGDKCYWRKIQQEREERDAEMIVGEGIILNSVHKECLSEKMTSEQRPQKR